MEEIGGLEIPLRSLWHTLHCRRMAGMSSLLSIGWWYLYSVSSKRHCCRISAEDKGSRVYPLDPHIDTVELYSGCTQVSAVPGFRQMTFTLPPLLDSADAKQTSKLRRKKCPPQNTSTSIKPKIEIKMAPHKPRKPAPVEYIMDEENIIVYYTEEVETTKCIVGRLSEENWRNHDSET
ncbi:uncharacterized protein TNCV_639861 [Trichonephila clavipes]|nr:uncharacterized protein TNCV_639861 [Trichonephila clavipes]